MIEAIAAALSFLIVTQAEARPWTVETLVAIEYPREALTTNVEGDVTIRCRIDSSGEVSSATRISGHPILAVAAVKNALKWKFRREVSSKEMSFTLVYHFRIIKEIGLTESVSGFRFVVPNEVFITTERNQNR